MVAALLTGAFFGGWDAGWSAALGVLVVFVNFVVHGLSMAWAAKVSLTVLYAVGVIGFALRLGVILALMFWLDRLAFFSPVAFALGVIPTTVSLLAYEMKLIGGGLGSELRLDAARPGAAR